MTYYVSSGTLNSTHSLTHCCDVVYRLVKCWLQEWKCTCHPCSHGLCVLCEQCLNVRSLRCSTRHIGVDPTGAVDPIKTLGTSILFAPIFLFFTLYMPKITRNLLDIIFSASGNFVPRFLTRSLTLYSIGDLCNLPPVFRKDQCPWQDTVLQWLQYV